MKDFINRVKAAINDEDCWCEEPLLFKVFVTFVFCFSFVSIFLFCVATFITVPLWGVPYTVYWCCKNKRKKEGAEK